MCYKKEVRENERNIKSKNNAIIYSNSVVVMLVFSLGGGRMKKILNKIRKKIKGLSRLDLFLLRLLCFDLMLIAIVIIQYFVMN